MAKKNIRVQDVTVSTKTGRVILLSDNHRYITSKQLLASKGIEDVFDLRLKTIGIETFDPGELLVNNTVYEQREESTLVKGFTSLPKQMSQQDKIADAIGRYTAAYVAQAMGYGAPAVAAVPATPVANGNGNAPVTPPTTEGLTPEQLEEEQAERAKKAIQEGQLVGAGAAPETEDPNLPE